MTVARYQCPRCQSVFVPETTVSAGSYARCPTCAGLAVPSHAEVTGPSHSVPDFEVPPLDTTGYDAPAPPGPPRARSEEFTLPELPLSSFPTQAAPAPVTLVSPAGGGLFSALLMGAPDLELSGPRQPVGAAHPVNHAESTTPDGPDVPTEDLPPPPLVGVHPAPFAYEVANTAMLMGPADALATVAPLPLPPLPPLAPPPSGLQGLNLPPGTSGVYLDHPSFSDKEFEAMLGGTFSPVSTEPPPSGSISIPDNWLVTNPGIPPPLRKVASGPPLPPGRVKTQLPASAAVLASLSPIPLVSSLGPVPKLRDGLSVIKALMLLLTAALLGGVAGVALAPAPQRPPSMGPEAAQHKLGQARKKLAHNQDGEALDLLQRALVLDPTLAEAQRDMGVALARQGRFEEAARAYQAYVEMSPRALDALSIENTLKQWRAGERKP